MRVQNLVIVDYEDNKGYHCDAKNLYFYFIWLSGNILYEILELLILKMTLGG